MPRSLKRDEFPDFAFSFLPDLFGVQIDLTSADRVGLHLVIFAGTQDTSGNTLTVVLISTGRGLAALQRGARKVILVLTLTVETSRVNEASGKRLTGSSGLLTIGGELLAE
jgi:hypothetical protein